MKDIQNQPDYRNIPINKVGIKNIKYPITVLDRTNGFQRTVAKINMYVNLSHSSKGTHMSRFIEIVSKYSNDISVQNLPNLLKEIKKRLNSDCAHIKITFPYFIKKIAPISASQSFMEYNVTYLGNLNKEETEIIVKINVPITTLCPCSREISKYGAHNQRSIVKLSVKFNRHIWIEDLIKLIENSSSSEIYSLLKREDEKYVTEHAYKHPMFVEDIVREIAYKLKKDPNITWFSVDSENFESIHNHSAYAFIENTKI